MSFYSLKYRLEFDDVIEDEFNDYKLEIHKKYDDGETPDSIVELTGTNSPVVINYNLTKDNIFAPIRSSYLDISIYHMDGMAADQFWDLYITQDDGFKVKLYKGADLFWNGWMGSSLVAEEQISSPYRVKLRAYDGLNLLKKTPFFDTTEVFQATANQFNDRYGYPKVKDVITKCLFNTGLIDNPTNQIISVIKIKNGSSTGTTLADDYFLDDTKIHHTSFLNGESDGMNCFEVLEMVLDSLGATIYQRDGNWCIVRISDLTQFDKDSPPTCRRDWFWKNVANPITINKTTSITEFTQASTYYTEDVPFFQIDGASSMTFQYPMKQVIVKQENDHNFITSNQLDSVNDLGASDPSGTLLFDEWEPLYGNSGLGIQEAVVLRDENYKNANANLTPRNDRNLGKALIEADAGTDGVTWRNQQPNLRYPVSHKTIKKQYDWNEFVENDAQGNPKYNWYTSGHVFSLKFRPLKQNSLATDNYIRVPFTLRMKADNTGTLGAYDLTTGRGTGNQISETVAYFASQYDDTGNLFRPFCQDTRKINEWQTVKLHIEEHALELDASALVGVTESCELESRIYGGFLWIEDVSSSGSTFTDRYDVTYTDIKASPTVTKWKIEPEKQEYTVEQSSIYSRVESYTVKLGSNICTTGKNCFIGFEHGTNNALLSFDNWDIVYRGGNTIQHIVALGHMLLYRIPIRRMDGTHYGNYKYGDRMVYDSGVNGSSGKFFPMGVQMDLRNARTTFSGDDLMNNYGFNVSFSRKIKWMGENNISETVDY
jgi:hypothetical protein